MSRFETEVLTREYDLERLARLKARCVDRAMARTPLAEIEQFKC